MPPLNHAATLCVKNVMGNAHIEGKVTVLPIFSLGSRLIPLQSCGRAADGFLSWFNVAFEGLWHFQATTVR